MKKTLYSGAVINWFVQGEKTVFNEISRMLQHCSKSKFDITLTTKWPTLSRHRCKSWRAWICSGVFVNAMKFHSPSKAPILHRCGIPYLFRRLLYKLAQFKGLFAEGCLSRFCGGELLRRASALKIESWAAAVNCCHHWPSYLTSFLWAPTL